MKTKPGDSYILPCSTPNFVNRFINRNNSEIIYEEIPVDEVSACEEDILNVLDDFGFN